MHDLVDALFADALAPLLTETLATLCECIPALQPLLKERLLHELSLVLAGRPFLPPLADGGWEGEGGGAGEPFSVGSLLGQGLSPQFGSLGGGGVPICTSPSVTSAMSAFGAPPSAALQSVSSLLALAGGVPGPGPADGWAGDVPGSVPAATSAWARAMPSSAYAFGGGGPGDGPSSHDGLSSVELAGARGVPPDLVHLALRTLRTFNFTTVPLLPFVREVVIMYLDDTEPSIRLEAALTACALLAQPSDLEERVTDPLIASAADVFRDDDEEGDGERGEEGLPSGEGGGSRLDEDDEDEDGVGALPPTSRGRMESGGDAQPAADSEATFHSSGGVAGAADVERVTSFRRTRRLLALSAVRLRPHSHPLLVFGTDMNSLGVGMGDYVSPVSALISSYAGALVAEKAASTLLRKLLDRVRSPAAAAYGTGASASSELLVTAIGPGPSLLLTSQVLERLTVVAVTDPDPSVRFEVLISLDPRFDQLLASEGNIRLLSVGLQDENFGVREAALAVLGRLTARNPALILLTLRRTLQQLVIELETGGDSLGPPPPNQASLLYASKLPTGELGGALGAAALTAVSNSTPREHAARMLSLLIRSSQRLVSPYVPILLRALIPRAWSASSRSGVGLEGSGGTGARRDLISDIAPPLADGGLPPPDELTACTLAAIGELSAVAPDQLIPFMPLLLSLAIEAITQGAHALGITVAGSGFSSGRAGGGDARDGGGGDGREASSAPTSPGDTPFDAPSAAAVAAVSHALERGADPVAFLEVAVRALCLLVENSSSVIVPYLDHPHLLALLLALLTRLPWSVEMGGGGGISHSVSSAYIGGAMPQSPGSPEGAGGANIVYSAGGANEWPLRREVMRTLGILGALDPYRYRMAQIAQAQRLAVSAQAQIQLKLAAAVAAARARGRRVGAAGLTKDVVARGLRPGGASSGGGGAGGGGGDATEDADLLLSGSSAWSLHSHLPMVTGLALGSGFDVDPLEAALAGLAGEPGANVGVNLDEMGLGLGIVGAAALGLSGLDGLLAGQPNFGEMDAGRGGAAAAPADAEGEGEGGVAGSPATGAPPRTDGQVQGGGVLAFVDKTPASAILPSMVASSEDFFPTVALAALLATLSDETLSLHHAGALAAVSAVLASLRWRCEAYLPRVVPVFLRMLRGGITGAGAGAALPTPTPTIEVAGAAPDVDKSAASPSVLREAALLQLEQLAAHGKQHLRAWLPDIFSLLCAMWPHSLPSSLRLVETIAGTLGEEAAPYLDMLVPHFLSVLSHDGGGLRPEGRGEGAPTSPQRGAWTEGDSSALPTRLLTRHVLNSLVVLTVGGRRALWGGHRRLLDDHMHSLVPAIARLMDAGCGTLAAMQRGGAGTPGTATSAARAAAAWATPTVVPSNSTSLGGYGLVAPLVRRQAIDTLAAFAGGGVPLGQWAPRIVQPLIRCLADTTGYTPLELKRSALDCLTLLLLQMREDFIVWIPSVRRALFCCYPDETGPVAEGSGGGGVSGAGAGGPLQHETYERLVALLLGYGSGYGWGGDDALALYGYGQPVTLPPSPVDLAALLYDPGLCNSDGSGLRIASCLSLLPLQDGPPRPPVGPGPGPSGNVMLDALAAYAVTLNVPGATGALTADEDGFSLNAGEPPANTMPSIESGGASGGGGATKLSVNQEALIRAWEVPPRPTKDDWVEWMRRLALELLRESPSLPLRAVAPLAQVYPPLAMQLFNAAFVAVWTELYDEYQESLVAALEKAFSTATTPISILQSLLALAEFMEHDEKALPIDVRTLGALAEKVRSFAKALHYKELEFHTSPMGCIEALISINNHLDQPEAAVGILLYAQQQARGQGILGFREAHVSAANSVFATGGPATDASTVPSVVSELAGANQNSTASHPAGSSFAPASSSSSSAAAPSPPVLEVQEGWYEKLGRWDDALDAYERKQAEAPNSLALVLGRMRCLRALGEWPRLAALAREAWPRLEGNRYGREYVAPLAARASWALGEWSELEGFLAYTDESQLEGSFYRAVLCVHRLSFDEAQAHIDNARRILGLQFTSASESYSRSYRRVVTLQQLSEMEEILTYLRLASGGNRAAAGTYLTHLRSVWEHRLRGCAKNVDVWNRILSVRSLITQPSDALHDWLQFASLCRRGGRMNMSLKVLASLGIGRGEGGGPEAEAARAATLDATLAAYLSPGQGGTVVLAGTSLGDVAPPGGPGYESYRLSLGLPTTVHPRVVYAYLKHLWWSGGASRLAAVSHMQTLSRALVERAVLRERVDSGGEVTPQERASVGVYGQCRMEGADENALRVQCHLRLGQWQEALIEPLVTPAYGGYGAPTTAGGASGEGGNSLVDGFGALADGASTPSSGPRAPLTGESYAALIAPIVSAFRTATHDCGDRGYGHYRAWHAWAIINFSAAEHNHTALKAEREKFKAERDKGTSPQAVEVAAGSGGGRGRQAVSPASAPPSGPAAQAPPPPSSFNHHAAVTSHAVAAVKGFFRSIALGRSRLKAYILQDLLRLLTLWFNHGENPPVRAALEAGLVSKSVSMEVWLQVIPQLVARISVQAPATRKLLHVLLVQIGSVHPQALIYPLTVATKSASAPRRQAAQALMSTLRQRTPRLVDHAEVVSRELIRVAILWHEMWHAGLEEASRLYFGDANIPAMLSTLMPLHEMMASPGPVTLREHAFVQAFGRELETAHSWLLAYGRSGRVGDLSQAWDIYYHVFRKINKQLPTMTGLELAAVSPSLLCAHDLELAVPGTYSASAPLVRIHSFCPSIDIIASKQRPRKVALLGSDGRRFTFLLKGHEDLRQDERVMQLFGLVNGLLANDGETSRRDLSIRRYAVTPLSHDVGVVGWVPNCDTLHALVRTYRESRKVTLNIEHRLMVQMAPMYDSLCVLQKIEVFRYALDNTTGADLCKVLWLKSASSEVWLERRTNYTRSLGVMSIVGYVLGLGDRHPSNLMLDRVSGKVLHIDFGDWCVCGREEGGVRPSRKTPDAGNQPSSPPPPPQLRGGHDA